MTDFIKIDLDGMDRVVGPEMLLRAKSGFYRNDGRRSLDQPDFFKAVGVTKLQADDYVRTNGLLIVGPATYRKLLVLASERAPHFKALFAVIDAREETSTEEFYISGAHRRGSRGL